MCPTINGGPPDLLHHGSNGIKGFDIWFFYPWREGGCLGTVPAGYLLVQSNDEKGWQLRIATMNNLVLRKDAIWEDCHY